MQPSTDVRAASHLPGVRALGSPCVGSWRLEGSLGEGRWTRVYRARPSAGCPHADYAVKVLRPEHEQDPVAIGLLRREAAVGRRVVHPHLVSVLAAHTEAPPFYIVTPCLEGATLRDTIRFAGRLDVPHALWLVRQAAEAMRELHRHGWLHNDIKPDNVFVGVTGHVTLLDLGLCSPLRRGLAGAAAVAGSPAYAAPELHFAHAAASAACDIYSLGVTLYESLTGGVPFPQSSEEELRAAVLTRVPPDPRRVAPSVSSRVARLLRRLLAKDPLRRPDADELVDWLAELEIETFDERKLASA